MNPDFNEPQPAPSDPEPSKTPATRSFHWRYWARRLLVCNPFFLCSAALLLFGVNRLSIDPNFLGEEKANLLFNYFALQFYELLVVGTAIVLARRKIWYDSALLVVMEHGLILVPFMLISQGTLLNHSLGIKLAIGALGFAVFRAAAVNRGYRQFNLPPRALVLGAVLLLLNATLATAFPSAVENDTDDWRTPNLVLWYVVLPLLTAAANLLPRPARYGGLNPERHWLPLFIYTLWIAGTGTHIWGLGYICKLEFHPYLLGPTAFIAAWTLWHRIGDCVPNPVPRWEIATVGLTFISPLTAFADSILFELLVALNFIAYAILFFRSGGARQRLLRELMVASGALLMLGLPEELGKLVLPAFSRTHAVILAVASFICISALRWLRVHLGLAGACAAMVIAIVLWPGAPLHLFVETAVIFLLAHSLGWRNESASASFVRGAAGAIWITDAAAWMHHARWPTDVAIVAIALGMLAAWFLLWWITSRRRDWMIFISSSAVTLVAPIDWLVLEGSHGLLALAASLALFAIGFSVAWTRHLWERTNGTPP